MVKDVKYIYKKENKKKKKIAEIAHVVSWCSKNLL